MKTKKNIVAFLIMILLLICIIYLSIGVKNDADYKIKFISLEGNVHLTKENYLGFAHLLDRNTYSSLTLQIIKDRIEKHPYIDVADVRYDGGNRVSIVIAEKKFHSLLISGEDQFIITEEMQVLPVLDNTKKIDYPVITNPVLNSPVKVLSSIRKNNDVMTASKIIDAVRLANPELQDALSSIDLQHGGEMLLYFSNVDYPVKIGKGNEIRKVFYYCNLWNSLKGKELNNYVEYVDMRYGGHIFLGIIEPEEITEKKS